MMTDSLHSHNWKPRNRVKGFASRGPTYGGVATDETKSLSSIFQIHVTQDVKELALRQRIKTLDVFEFNQGAIQSLRARESRVKGFASRGLVGSC